MAFIAGIDVVGDATIGDVLEDFDRYSGTITKHVANGPGGGNPYVELSFETHQSAMDFLRQWVPDEEDDFLKTLICEV